MLNKLHLPFATSIPLALRLMAEQLALQGRPDLGGECMELAATAGDVKVPFKIPAVDLLCAMCDEAHRRKDAELVARLEELVQALKLGQKRMVTATINKTVRTIGELDGALEDLRGNLIKGVGG